MALDSCDQFHRLTKNVIPRHYEITIRPNLKTFKFTGNVKIDVTILVETRSIELHSLDLAFSKVEFITDNQESIEFERVERSVVNESATIYFKSAIQIGTGRLSIEFDGTINENSNGFYKTKCLARDGTVQFAAATQFEASYARKAFPCFDEPSFKATFDIIIVADRSKTVLSNMTTPIMSTYLVAYVVGDYDFIEELSDAGTLVRVYTPVGMSELGRFSLELSVKALSFFANYFDIGYELPKLDLIGLGFVDIEAMENFGLLVFKESLLLIDQSNYSVQSRAICALTVAHEIAHQWFGNLVTMEWWTDLWLNEGFATYAEYLCVDYCFPEWNVWNLYATDHLYRAYHLDSLKSSHPIEVPIGQPSEITQIFDSISYCKGSSILRMLNDYVGSECFVAGLRNYLKTFKYANASSEDLWNELDKAAPNKNVKSLMQIWTKEKGYPKIKVSRKFDASNHTILCLEQSKWLLNPEKVEKLNENEIVWNIPISVITESSYPNVYAQVLMKTKTCEIDLGLQPSTDWIKLNKDNIGFYIVHYAQDLFANQAFSLNQIESFGSPLDRYGLVMETFSLAMSGEISAIDLINMIWHFRNETNAYVWIALIKNLLTLSKFLLNMPFYDKFKVFLGKLFEPIKLKIGFNVRSSDDDQKKLLRENVLYILAKIDDDDFGEFAENQFLNRANEKIDADLQKAIYASVLQNGNINVVEEFIDMYQSCSTPEEKERIAIQLGEVSNWDTIEYVLNFAISDVVTLEETVFIIVSLANNSTCKYSAKSAWEFIKRNWQLIHSRYSDSALLGRLLKPVLENFSSIEMCTDIEKFFADNEARQAEFSIKQAIEIINGNFHFLHTQTKEFEKYFSSTATSTLSTTATATG